MSESMDLYPAIDLLGGEVVRLRQGAYGERTGYGSDPVAVAVGFAASGARWIHVVDLDAARSGEGVNRGVVTEITAAVGPEVAVQTGGGVRTMGDVEELAAAGVGRVVIGSAAMRTPTLVAQAATVLPVAVGLDHRDGEVAVHGWTESAGIRLLDAVERFPDVAALVVTNIASDGMLAGPDVAGLAGVAAGTAVPVIASGGVGSVEDVRALAELGSLAGVIVGSALYEGRVTVEAALVELAATSGDGAGGAGRASDRQGAGRRWGPGAQPPQGDGAS